MTTAFPTPDRTEARTRRAPLRPAVPGPRLRLVADQPERPHIGYLVFLPDGVDPVELLTAHGVRPEIHPLAPRTLPAPERPPAEGGTPRDGALHDGALHDGALQGGVPRDDAVRVDPDRHTAHVDGRELDLTYLEFSLLAHLVAHPRTVHTREALMARIWGYDHIGDGRTVDVHVARLRRKLGTAHRNRIVTVRRVGYKYLP
ncbi:winged helix-turn-helix domain-containing protein [Streptomyces sp. NPDC003090]|uniref:winged helix-turn-helix domain-containing protein n=1 Tax=Streptomyces sp. NPDC003090 TaxID=3154274 RepID=UPI00380B7AF5